MKGKIHKIVWRERKPYYRCNRAVGVLSGQQIIFRTNSSGKRVTCKNCKKWKEDLEEKRA